MNFPEAMALNDSVARALQTKTPSTFFAYPISALRGASFLDAKMAMFICGAFRWQLVFNKPDADEEMRKLADGVVLACSHFRWFVPDELIAQADAEKRVWSYENGSNEQIASTRDIDSFVEFLKSLNPKADMYWQQVYTRLGLPYLDDCPHGLPKIDFVAGTATLSTFGEWKRSKKGGCSMLGACLLVAVIWCVAHC